VQFQPDSARSIAIGSADHKIYCYDLRNIRAPYCTLVGHTKTVSYVKYVDASTIVSASTDNSLKLWDLSMSQARIIDSPLRTFTGHTNTKVRISCIPFLLRCINLSRGIVLDMVLFYLI
jgi:WD40 repeat protein